MWDYMTPVEEIARGLDDLVRQGKVSYVAFSDTPDYIVAEANTRADLIGWSRFIGMQVPYSLLDRAVERSIIPMAKHWDMAVLPWGLLEAGTSRRNPVPRSRSVWPLDIINSTGFVLCC
jgi:aryl-alcohol dehydrogenase-like predicted oxidoreductase